MGSGFFEHLQIERSRAGHYGELAWSLPRGPWEIMFAAGAGNVPALRPSRMLAAQAAHRIPAISGAVIVGASGTSVHGEARSDYRFISLAMTTSPVNGLSLTASGYHIRHMQPASDAHQRLGVGGGIAVLARPSVSHEVGASANSSCVASNVYCRGDDPARYREFFLSGKIRLAADTWATLRVGHASSPDAAQVWSGIEKIF